jgi:hypothetical protein
MGLDAVDPGDKGGDFAIPPQQIHQAVCYSVYDIGTHHDNQYGMKHKVLVFFELTHCRAKFEKDGEEKDLAMVRSIPYNLTLGKKANLRRDIESWFNKKFEEPEDGSKLSFDLEKLIGKNCQVQIMHVKGMKNNEPTTYANISMVIAPAEGQNLVPENPTGFFSFADYPGVGIPENCPDWVVKKIMASQEWAFVNGGGANANPQTSDSAPPDDDIPF